MPNLPRALTLDDRGPWADLLALAFHRMSEEVRLLLDWLHAGHEVIAQGIWENGRLVAQYCVSISELWVPDRAGTTPVGLSINLAVHPDFRGRGLVKTVAAPVYAALRERGAAAGVGFSNAEGVKVDRRSHSYGYQVLGRMTPRLIWLSRREVTSPLPLTDTWPSAPLAIDRPANGDGLLRFAATPASVRHRFALHPFRRYHFGVWEDEAGIRGLVVYRPQRRGTLRGAALLAAYGSDLPQLLGRWVQALRGRGMRFVQALVTPTSTLDAALRPLGWRVALPLTRAPYYLTVKPLQDDSPAGLLDFRSWDCCGGDVL